MEADSFIECIFHKEGTDFRLSWRPDSKHELHIFSDGEWMPDSHWSADRFPLSIYSQKMLYELASDTGAFLRVCDESPVVNKLAWKERWDQLEREYLNEQITLRGLRARQGSADSLRGNYRMLNVPSVSCSQAPIIRFADSWPSPETSCPQQPYPWSTLSGVLQPFRLWQKNRCRDPISRRNLPVC